jgi:hypothetical protein
MHKACKASNLIHFSLKKLKVEARKEALAFGAVWFMEADSEVDGDAVVVFFMLVGELEVPSRGESEEQVGFKFGVGGFVFAVPTVAHFKKKGPIWGKLIKEIGKNGVASIGYRGVQKVALWGRLFSSSRDCDAGIRR